MEPLELAQIEKDIRDKSADLINKLNEQKRLVKTYADSERIYRIELRKEMLLLKSDGMNATLIPDIAKGNEKVAELRFKRDVDKGISFACKDAIESIQTVISGLQSILSRHKTEIRLL